MPRPVWVSALVLAALIALARPAGAEPIGLGFESVVGRSFAGEIGYGWTLEANGFATRGPLRLTLSLPIFFMHSDHPERDTHDLKGFGLGAHLGYARRISSLLVYAGAGIERDWMLGGTIVRDCMFTHTCIAGTYTEDVSYHAWTPQLRVAVGPSLDAGDGLFAGSFEIIFRAPRISDVPPSGVNEITVTAALSLLVDWERRRQ